MTRKTLSAQELYCFTTHDLLNEIQRRSIGCMVVVMRAEENGDTWRYALKGSPILLGAMSAALKLETRRRLQGPEEGALVEVGA
jgi:hypothetical protein